MMATSGKPLSDQEQERIRKLRDAGLSIREIAKAQMVSPTTVKKKLNNALAK